MSEWQSRYLAYCRAHRATPGEMEIRDRKRWPGGFMTGYIQWICEQWRVWAAETGESLEHKTADSHRRFDAWLDAQPVKRQKAKVVA